MRTAETILTVICERGTRGLPLERVYRLLFNRDLYLRAYAKLYPNKGAMTPGSTAETVDGMSLAKIDRLIDELRHERFRWTPVRRTYIAKKNSTKKRPLGLPMWAAYCTPCRRFWEYWVCERARFSGPLSILPYR
jgi:hypothetical protein